MAFLSLIARGIPICCPPGIDFKVVMRLPFLHPVLHFFAPHLPTCSPHREKICFSGAISTWWRPGVASVMCPSGVAALVLSVTQAEVRSPGWGRPRSGLKKEQELCALFSAMRAEFCLTVSTFCFLIRRHSQTWLIPGYPAPWLPHGPLGSYD